MSGGEAEKEEEGEEEENEEEDVLHVATLHKGENPVKQLTNLAVLHPYLSQVSQILYTNFVYKATKFWFAKGN